MKVLLSLYSFVFETLGLWFVVMLLTFISGATEVGRGYMAATVICCIGITDAVEHLKGVTYERRTF